MLINQNIYPYIYLSGKLKIIFMISHVLRKKCKNDCTSKISLGKSMQKAFSHQFLKVTFYTFIWYVNMYTLWTSRICVTSIGFKKCVHINENKWYKLNTWGNHLNSYKLKQSEIHTLA